MNQPPHTTHTPPRARFVRAGVLVLIAGLCVSLFLGCEKDARTEPLPNEEIWGGEEQEAEVPIIDNIQFADRANGVRFYGLPCDSSTNSLGDLIRLMDNTPTGFGSPDIFVAPGVEVTTDQCRGDQPGTFQELPMTIEATVTLHPRQYAKVTVCGQDERNYGTFTVEDDTGGIVVLRNSRVAPFTYGDRIRLNIQGVMRTFGSSLDTRAILIADIEPAITNCGNVPLGTVLYSRQEGEFSPADVGFTRRIEGYSHIAPTNDNFNSMAMTSERFTAGIAQGKTLEGNMLSCVRSCEGICARGESSPAVCADVCYERCDTAIQEGLELRDAIDQATTNLPDIWFVGIDAELGRRGFRIPAGSHIRVTGPVVNSFDRQIWILSTGQVDFIDE